MKCDNDKQRYDKQRFRRFKRDPTNTRDPGTSVFL